MWLRKHRISSFQIIIIGFLAVIGLGTLLLMLPFATRQPGGAGFTDALFTATSATCVTGLVVQDTATYWSGFGQAVILCLIQIGGMGVVTVALAISLIMGKRISLMQRNTMKEAISAPNVGGIVKMTGFILGSMFLFELLGAVSLAIAFCPEFGFWKGLWYAIFHAVSAFCNAGFDLMGAKAPFSSLTAYATHPLVNITVMLLIIIGGVGFFTWHDIFANKHRWGHYRLQSKVVLLTSALLILLPGVYFFFFEFSQAPLGQRIWLSVFQSVTTRTAGFNTADQAALTESGSLLTIVLMLVGGSPGSTAGGMKTTTFAVLLLSAVAVFRRKEDPTAFGRRIGVETVRNAAAILLMYITLFLAGGMIISIAEDLPLLTCLFETASAIGTVGLTQGITGQLGLLSRIILICLMYFGRVGGLTLIFAALSGKNPNVSKYPLEKITVG